jgi:hypothetical protein
MYGSNHGNILASQTAEKLAIPARQLSNLSIIELRFLQVTQWPQLLRANFSGREMFTLSATLFP